MFDVWWFTCQNAFTLYVSPANCVRINSSWELLSLIRQTNRRHILVEHDRRVKVQYHKVVVQKWRDTKANVSGNVGDGYSLYRDTSYYPFWCKTKLNFYFTVIWLRNHLPFKATVIVNTNEYLTRGFRVIIDHGRVTWWVLGSLSRCAPNTKSVNPTALKAKKEEQTKNLRMRKLVSITTWEQ